jgi:hypothetical protein
VNQKLQEIDDNLVESNIIPIRTATDLGQSIEDWLSKLDEGTVFLCQHISTKYREYVLEEYTILVKSETGAIGLKDTFSQHPLWVIPSIFCRKYSLFGVL